MPDRYMPPMLQASTAHIRQSTAQALTACLEHREGALWELLSYVAWHSYGWIIWVGPDLVPQVVSAGYADLAKLIEEAQSRDCQYLQLDCDGPVYPDLDQYEWA